MHVLTALDSFYRRRDRTILPADIEVDGTPAWPEAATAAAMLSGQLDDAVTDDDLDDAVRHFISLFEIGVLSQEQWDSAIQEVLCELLAWGNEQEAAAALAV